MNPSREYYIVQDAIRRPRAIPKGRKSRLRTHLALFLLCFTGLIFLIIAVIYLTVGIGETWMGFMFFGLFLCLEVTVLLIGFWPRLLRVVSGGPRIPLSTSAKGTSTEERVSVQGQVTKSESGLPGTSESTSGKGMRQQTRTSSTQTPRVEPTTSSPRREQRTHSAPVILRTTDEDSEE